MTTEALKFKGKIMLKEVYMTQLNKWIHVQKTAHYGTQQETEKGMHCTL